MSNPLKYVLMPVWVESKHDGVEHYVGMTNLMHLYGVKGHECLSGLNRSEKDLNEFIQKGMIILRPRPAGDYREYLESLQPKETVLRRKE